MQYQNVGIVVQHISKGIKVTNFMEFLLRSKSEWHVGRGRFVKEFRVGLFAYPIRVVILLVLGY